MPNIYQQRSQPFSDSENEPENIAPVATDADDSIVLSDLVRTGEASRLRRRGALRLDHNHASQTIQQRSFSPSVIVVGSPSWDSEPEDPQAGQGVSRVTRYTRARSQRPRRVREEETRYSLFCGGDVSDSDGDVDDRACTPFVPSPLPAYPASSSTLPPPVRHQRRKKRMNGCGALLHMNAIPRPRQATWSAKGDASCAVIDMEPYYFDKESVAKIVRSACGCVREGVGCAVCGNPLGTRYKACQTGDTIPGARHKSSGPIHPEGPRYWRSHPPQHTSNTTEFYVYTFFSHSVSSSPHYTFPARRTTVLSPSPTYPLSPSSIQPQEQTQLDQEPDSSENDDTTATYTNTMFEFDRFMTASPAPLPEEERRPSYAVRGLRVDTPLQAPIRGVVYRDQPGFDPDGEYILDPEPGSPDKTNEATLLPER